MSEFCELRKKAENYAHDVQHCLHSVGYNASSDKAFPHIEIQRCCWCGEFKETKHGHHVFERLAHSI